MSKIANVIFALTLGLLLTTKALARDTVESPTDFTYGILNTNLDYSRMMFDRQIYVTDKMMRYQQARADGTLNDDAIYIGGRGVATYMREHTNTPGKFPILSRLPTQHTSGRNGNEFVINDASINLSAHSGWVSFFGQGEYTEVEYPGQDEFQWRKYSIILGNLRNFPFYLAFGRNTVDFGNFTTYAPFTHNHNSHYFWSQSDDPHFELGYVATNWNATFSLLPNDRGLRVIHAPDRNGYENFAINIDGDIALSDQLNLNLGGGFLRGSIYDSVLAHHPPGVGLDDKDWNPIWDIHATISWPRTDVMMEYTRTVDDWPATGREVSAATIQARYHDTIATKPTIYSWSFSRGEHGKTDTEWEQMIQNIVGIETRILPNVEIGAEYVFNAGFVPLIRPRVTGDRGVRSHTIILGAEITF